MSTRIERGWARDVERMVNFRARPEDQRIIEDLAVSTDRDLTFIMRRALRVLRKHDLMQPLDDGDEPDDSGNGHRDPGTPGGGDLDGGSHGTHGADGGGSTTDRRNPTRPA